MNTITVKCIANSYNNAGLSLSKGQVAEVEDNAIVRNAIKTKYLQEVAKEEKKTTDLKKEDVKAKTEDLKLEEPKTTSTKKRTSK